MVSQHFQNNFSGLTGPSGVPVSLNADQVHQENVLELVTAEMNSVLAKKKKLKLVRTFHHVQLTNMNVLLIVKDRVQRITYIPLVWRPDNPDKGQNGDQ